MKVSISDLIRTLLVLILVFVVISWIKSGCNEEKEGQEEQIEAKQPESYFVLTNMETGQVVYAGYTPWIGYMDFSVKIIPNVGDSIILKLPGVEQPVFMDGRNHVNFPPWVQGLKTKIISGKKPRLMR